MRDSLYVVMMSLLPRKRVGRLIGAIAGWSGHGWFSRRLVRWFARRYRVNLQEIAQPIDAFPNLATFFTRRLTAGARPVDPDPAAVVSPVDGIVGAHGPIAHNVCLQAKGKTYTLEALLGGDREARPYHDGHYLTLYLSPRHYHRIHAPVAGGVVRYHHIPGHLFPVNPAAVRHVDRLFAVNERVITAIRVNLPGNPEILVVKVGAIGVGRIRVVYFDRLTNRPGQFEREERFEPPYPVEKGAELGAFELGSTVILVFPPDLVALERFEPGEELKVGQRIGTLKPLK